MAEQAAGLARGALAQVVTQGAVGSEREVSAEPAKPVVSELVSVRATQAVSGPLGSALAQEVTARGPLPRVAWGLALGDGAVLETRPAAHPATQSSARRSIAPRQSDVPPTRSPRRR